MIADVSGDYDYGGIGVVLDNPDAIGEVLSRISGEEILKAANRAFVTAEPAQRRLQSHLRTSRRSRRPARVVPLHRRQGPHRLGGGDAAHPPRRAP